MLLPLISASHLRPLLVITFAPLFRDAVGEDFGTFVSGSNVSLCGFDAGCHYVDLRAAGQGDVVGGVDHFVLPLLYGSHHTGIIRRASVRLEFN